MNEVRSVSPVSSRMLTAIVFVGGMTTLAIELSASRLLGAVFGVSNLVWANIIGLILASLSAGYFLGGRWADKDPDAQLFYKLVVWSAFLGGLIPLAARSFLPWLEGLTLNLALAVPIALLSLFAVPVVLLGCITPFAIRLALRDLETTGQTAGKLYAVSTLGSASGSLLSTLYLLPSLGTTATFALFSLIQIAVGGVALSRSSKKHVLYTTLMALCYLALLLGQIG